MPIRRPARSSSAVSLAPHALTSGPSLLPTTACTGAYADSSSSTLATQTSPACKITSAVTEVFGHARRAALPESRGMRVGEDHNAHRLIVPGSSRPAAVGVVGVVEQQEQSLQHDCRAGATRARILAAAQHGTRHDVTRVGDEVAESMARRVRARVGSPPDRTDWAADPSAGPAAERRRRRSANPRHPSRHAAAQRRATKGPVVSRDEASAIRDPPIS